jgi:uncharacterized membrane protein YdjX (TVP38/TMEM64 family)
MKYRFFLILLFFGCTYAYVCPYLSWAVVWYVLIMIVITGLAVPTGGVMTLIGGFLFDVIPATIYSLGASTVGASITFLVVRHVLGLSINQKYAGQLSRFNKELQRAGAVYLLLIRLNTVIPFFLVNIIAGFTSVSLRLFIWTTALGTLPAIFIFSYAGKHLATMTKVTDLFSGTSIVLLGLMALVALVPVLMKRP